MHQVQIGDRKRKNGTCKMISGTSMASSHVAGTTALYIASRNCTGTPQEETNNLRSDAENKSNLTAATPCYGFTGDPNSTATSIYYVYLEYAGGG